MTQRRLGLRTRWALGEMGAALRSQPMFLSFTARSGGGLIAPEELA